MDVPFRNIFGGASERETSYARRNIITQDNIVFRIFLRPGIIDISPPKIRSDIKAILNRQNSMNIAYLNHLCDLCHKSKKSQILGIDG